MCDGNINTENQQKLKETLRLYKPTQIQSTHYSPNPNPQNQLYAQTHVHHKPKAYPPVKKTNQPNQPNQPTTSNQLSILPSPTVPCLPQTLLQLGPFAQ